MNNFLRNSISALFVLLFLAQCKKKSGDEPYGKLLARVYGEELYASEVQSIFGKFSSSADSIAAVKDYIKAWARQQVLLHEAKETLSDEEKDKSLQLDQYLNDLLIYEVEQKLIARRLDTLVSDEEINKYYDANKDNFELKENIVRLIFFKLPINVSAEDKLWNQFKRGKKEDYEDLTMRTVEMGGNFFRDEDVWLSFNDITKEVPIQTYNQENFLNNTTVFKVQDMRYVYFVKILDFKIRNSLSPLEFERDKIRNIILNKRKVSMLRSFEEKLWRKAEENDKLTLF